jgi:hypothetical protein
MAQHPRRQSCLPCIECPLFRALALELQAWRHKDRNSPDSQLMPLAIPQGRRDIHSLRAVGTRVHQLHAVRAGELQGQVRILLASGPKAKHCPLGQSLKPQTNCLTFLRSHCLTWVHDSAACVKKSLGSGLLYNLNGLPEGWLNVVVEWLTHLLRIREVPGSNLGTETGYPEEGFGVFLSHSRQIQG